MKIINEQTEAKKRVELKRAIRLMARETNSEFIIGINYMSIKELTRIFDILKQ